MDDGSGRWRGDFMSSNALIRILLAVFSILAASASTAHGQTAENVAVVVNENSADSQRIADSQWMRKPSGIGLPSLWSDRASDNLQIKVTFD
jgi:hypothetical protein